MSQAAKTIPSTPSTSSIITQGIASQPKPTKESNRQLILGIALGLGLPFCLSVLAFTLVYLRRHTDFRLLRSISRLSKFARSGGPKFRVIPDELHGYNRPPHDEMEIDSQSVKELDAPSPVHRNQ